MIRICGFDEATYSVATGRTGQGLPRSCCLQLALWDPAAAAAAAAAAAVLQARACHSGLQTCDQRDSPGLAPCSKEGGTHVGNLIRSLERLHGVGWHFRAPAAGGFVVVIATEECWWFDPSRLVLLILSSSLRTRRLVAPRGTGGGGRRGGGPCHLICTEIILHHPSCLGDSQGCSGGSPRHRERCVLSLALKVEERARAQG